MPVSVFTLFSCSFSFFADPMQFLSLFCLCRSCLYLIWGATKRLSVFITYRLPLTAPSYILHYCFVTCVSVCTYNISSPRTGVDVPIRSAYCVSPPLWTLLTVPPASQSHRRLWPPAPLPARRTSTWDIANFSHPNRPEPWLIFQYGQ